MTKRRVIKLAALQILALIFFTDQSATAAPKKLSELFPALPNIDSTQIYDRHSNEYHTLVLCKGAVNKAATCNPAGIPRFYDLSSSPEVDDTFDLTNRCTGFKGMMRYQKSTSPGATTVPGQVVLTATTVDCPNVEPTEVVAAQLVVCYERANGVNCNFATACFEGSQAKGLCTKDYQGEKPIVSIAP